MINLTKKLKVKKANYEIRFFEVETLTDLNFMIIKFALLALEEGKTFKEKALEFTGNENDLYCLLVKRLEIILKLKKYEKIEEDDSELLKSRQKDLQKMYDEKKKYNVAFKNETIYYFDEIDKFYKENDKNSLYDLNDIENVFKNDFKHSNKIYDSIRLLNDDEVNDDEDDYDDELNKPIEENFDLLVKKDFKSFQFLKDKNEENFYSINILEEIKTDYKKITQNNIERSFLELIVPINEITSEKILIRNLKIKENIDNVFLSKDFSKQNSSVFEITPKNEIIITNLFNYEGIIFSKENKITFKEFKSNLSYYEALFSWIENNISSDNFHTIEKLKRLILKEAETREDFLFIKRNVNYKLDIKSSLEKVPLMNQYKINFINENEKDFIGFEMYNKMINDSFVEYYKYIKTFNYLFLDIMNESKKITLFSKIFNFNKNILTKEDLEWFVNFKESKNLLEKRIIELVSSFSTKRGIVDQLLNNFNENIKKNNGKEENIEKDKITNELEDWKRVCNFFVHLNDKNQKQYKKDEKVIKEKYNKLPEIKNKIHQISSNDLKSNKLEEEDLNYVQDIVLSLDEFIDSKKDLKEFKKI